MKKLIGIFIMMLLIGSVILPLASSSEKTHEYSNNVNHFKTSNFDEFISIEIMNNLPDYFNWRNHDGKDWTTHANYKSHLYCPNCGNKGRIQSNNIKVITCIEDDTKDWFSLDGKPGQILMGRKVLIGKYADIQSGSEFKDNILQSAIKVVVDGFDYRINQVRPISLLSIFSFEASIERLDSLGLPSNNVLTT